MPEIKKAPTDIRIYGSDSSQYRDIDANLLKLAKEQAKKAQDAGLPPQLAAMIIPLVILEGNGKPFGVTKGQDVAVSRLPTKIRATLKGQPDNFGRLNVDKEATPDASLAILSDKFHYFKANNLDFTINDVLNRFNGDKTLEEKTGKPYSGHIEAVFKDITENPKNSQVFELMKPFLGIKK